MQNDWNLGEQKKKGIKQTIESAVVVGLVQKDQTEAQILEYLDELEFLALTAGAKSVRRFMQKLPHPDSRTFIGKGKLEEIKAFIDAN